MPEPSDHTEAVEQLPRALQTLWGLGERARPGPKPGLSLERILERGIAIADAEGLDALSMSRLAKDLGFTTMSLYRYVSSKDELLTLLVDTATGPAPVIGPEVVGWRNRLAAWVDAQMKGLAVHPWIVQLPITGAPLTPHTLEWVDQGLAMLAGIGLSEFEKVAVIGLIAGNVRHETLLRADITRAITDAAARGVPRTPDDVLLGRLVAPERFPALAATIAAGAWSDEQDPDNDFDFGVQRILDGVEALVATRSPTGAQAVPPAT
ncbi:TetR/AcrR family transcriptional regulator [Angustibacter sp. McL0619]|uniref:TetR/AcrR family transcriptional regulator n=1 Tax=Angustibacter sp. McL0619 TaxID=3415676 RepID=UPI003CED49D6